MVGKVDWFAAGLPGEGKATTMTRIGDLVVRDVPTCALDEKVGEVRDRLGPDDVCLVVNDHRTVLGVVDGEDLQADDDRAVSEVMQEGPSTIRPNVPALVLAPHLEGGAFPWGVVTTPEGELVGILRGSDLESWAVDEGEEQIAALHEGHDHG